MEGAAQAFGNTASIFKKHTIAYKVASSAQALIDTYLSAIGAYKAVVGIVPVGPVLAPIAAAAAIAAGLANVARINSVKGFYSGGDTGDGNPYDVAGTVHKKEWVITSQMRQHPFVMNVLPILEAIRTNRSFMGSSNTMQTNPVQNQQNQVIISTDPAAVSLLQEISRKLDNPTRAWVSLRELDDVSTLRDEILNSVSP